MSERITLPLVRSAFSRYVDECAKHGYDIEGWMFEEGSASDGRSFRVYGKDYSSAPGASGDGYIGWSRREAYDTLSRMANLMFDLRQSR